MFKSRQSVISRRAVPALKWSLAHVAAGLSDTERAEDCARHSPGRSEGVFPSNIAMDPHSGGEGVDAFAALRVSALPGLTAGLKILFCSQMNENGQSKRLLVITWGSCCYQEIWFICCAAPPG